MDWKANVDWTTTDPEMTEVLQERAFSVPRTLGLSALERRWLYARLLWCDDYGPLFAMTSEAAAPIMDQFMSQFVSAHTQRLMLADSAAGQRARDTVQLRLADSVLPHEG